jgi:flavin reductase (DIM6/NTAB) family NADH-FMN oxidoreductase RutF
VASRERIADRLAWLADAMDARLELRIADMPAREVYPWLTASVVPRAIAWVSSTSADGVDNLAPHSFTTVASDEPPTLCFVSVGHKDTLANVRATGEFVLNIGTAAQLRAMNDSATDFPPAEGEFDAAAVQREPSHAVRPPRVAGAPIAFECRAAGEHEIGRCVMVFGEIVHIAVDPRVLASDGLPDAVSLAPLARLGRAEWTTLGEVISLPRIRYTDWQDGRRSE